MKTSLISMSLLVLLCSSAFAKVSAGDINSESYTPKETFTAPYTNEQVRSLCYSNTSDKFRTITLIQAGAGKMSYDFSKVTSLIVDARVSVRVGNGDILTCFYEKSTIQFKQAQRNSLGEISVSVNTRSRTESEELDGKLKRMREQAPYDWSTSEYYQGVIQKAFAPIYKSELSNIPFVGGTALKVLFSVNDKTIPTVISTPYANANIQDGISIYATVELLPDGKTPYVNTFTHEGLQMATSRMFDPSVKICNKLSDQEFESELASGLSIDALINKHYGRTCP